MLILWPTDQKWRGQEVNKVAGNSWMRTLFTTGRVTDRLLEYVSRKERERKGRQKETEGERERKV